MITPVRIVVEGGPGSGKSIVSKIISDALAKEGITAELVDSIDQSLLPAGGEAWTAAVNEIRSYGAIKLQTKALRRIF